LKQGEGPAICHAVSTVPEHSWGNGEMGAGAWSRENGHITEAKGTLACHLVRIHLEPLIAIFMLEQKREGGNHFYRGGSYY